MWFDYFFHKVYTVIGLLNFKGSKTYLRIIEIIPIVVLTPIIFQAIFFVSENDISILINPKFYAAVVGVIVSLYFQNVIYTIIGGMLSFWIIKGLF